MKFALSISLWLTLVLCGSAFAQAEPAAPAEMISAYRLQHGEGQVTEDPALTRVAHEQAAAMAAKDVLDHSVLAPFSSRVAVVEISTGRREYRLWLRQFPENTWHVDRFPRTPKKSLDARGIKSRRRQREKFDEPPNLLGDGDYGRQYRFPIVGTPRQLREGLSSGNSRSVPVSRRRTRNSPGEIIVGISAIGSFNSSGWAELLMPARDLAGVAGSRHGYRRPRLHRRARL